MTVRPLFYLHNVFLYFIIAYPTTPVIRLLFTEKNIIKRKFTGPVHMSYPYWYYENPFKISNLTACFLNWSLLFLVWYIITLYWNSEIVLLFSIVITSEYALFLYYFDILQIEFFSDNIVVSWTSNDVRMDMDNPITLEFSRISKKNISSEGYLNVSYFKICGVSIL